MRVIIRKTNIERWMQEGGYIDKIIVVARPRRKFEVLAEVFVDVLVSTSAFSTLGLLKNQADSSFTMTDLVTKRVGSILRHSPQLLILFDSTRVGQLFSLLSIMKSFKWAYFVQPRARHFVS